MKVLDINKVSSDIHSQYPMSEKQSGADTGSKFHLQITTMNENAYQKYITDLRNRIIDQGNILKKKADIKELQQYRLMITELVRETVSNSFECTSKNSFDARGRHKVFVLIRNVNKKLDEMTKEILSEQADNLKIMDMVDDIRGLLVDMFL